GLKGDVLLSTVDVSQRVRATDRTRRAEVIAEIEREGCGAAPRTRCEVVSLYDGGQFKLYKFRRYDDVRLVFAPELDIAAFGGDPDNFMFPRYGFDVALVRLYDDGSGAQTPQHLSVESRAPTDGELVFLSGNPAATNRQLTVAQFETQRDIRVPLVEAELAELRGRMIRFAQESPDHERRISEALFSVENYLKYIDGSRLTLANRRILETKRS